MHSKHVITLALVFIWATFEYFMQFGPLAHMSYLWWLITGVIMWSVGFWFIDVIGTQIQPKTKQKPPERPIRSPLQVFMSLGRIVYLWIPLLLLIYLLFRTYDPAKVSGFLLWGIQGALSVLALLWARRYLVKKYCDVKQQILLTV
jgi:hypothetical protein